MNLKTLQVLAMMLEATAGVLILILLLWAMFG